MTKRILTTALIITLMSCITGCGSNDQKDKLYYSIDNNNLQGLTEVLADDFLLEAYYFSSFHIRSRI